MAYSVMARRYRPQTFEEVVGQEHVATTLRNAITDGRVGHAYLFCGPRGVGKTSMARIFAKALNCVKGPTPDPCGKCESCLRTAEGGDSDVIEMDAASNRGVDDARTLRESVHYAPMRSRFKIYIIDEAHMLTKEAFNTLLKTLEEPPPHVKFFFATTEPDKLLDTIVSRCQRFDFRRITTADVVKRLKQICKQESSQVQEEALTAVARATGGSMRDAESLLDQLTAYTSGPVTLKQVQQLTGHVSGETCAHILQAVKEGNVRTILEELDRAFTAGVEPAVFLRQLMDRFRALLVIKACGAGTPILDLTAEEKTQFTKESESFAIEAILYFSQILLETSRRLKEGMDPRVVLEMALIKMAKSADMVSIPELIQRLQETPAAVAAPSTPKPAAPPPAELKKKLESDIAPAQYPPARATPMPAAVRQEESDETSGAPEDPVPVGPLTLEEIRKHWHRVLDEVKTNRMTVAACLRDGRVERLQGDDVVVAFGRRYNFHKLQFDDRENRSVVESAMHRVLGRKLSLHCVLEDGPEPAASATSVPAAAEKPRPAETILEPNVKKLIQVFEGRVVNLEG